MPVRRERFIMDLMVGDIASDMYLRTVVGMGSRSQDEFDDRDIKLLISSNLAWVKEERIGGVKAGVGESEWRKGLIVS